MITPERLKQLLYQIPRKPGVYMMIDAYGNIIYIGKSRVLKNRIKSYFSGKRNDRKTEALVQAVENIQFIVTSNEIEALILENNLIKRYKPRYNVLLKDSKTHPYIVITLSELYPRILKVRKVKYSDGNQYFGPFPDESGLRYILDMIGRINRLCVCKKPIKPNKRNARPCLRFHLNLCQGPCINAVTPEKYSESVRDAIDFLSGKKPPDFAKLQAEMEKLASEYRYEEAAEIRNTIDGLKNFFTLQKVELIKAIDRDIWGTAFSIDKLVVSIFFLRSGKLLGNRTIELEREPGLSAEEMVETAMIRFYEQNLIPPYIVCSCRPTALKTLQEHFSNLLGKRVRIGKGRGNSQLKQLLQMADENAREILKNLKSDESGRVSDAVIDLETRLHLPKMPRRIECIDISHVQGTDPVASLVVAINGEPRRSEYRLYHIKTVTQINDPASIAEVTRRRFSRLLAEGATLPDLLIVDGGVAQANAAWRELEQLKIYCPVFGLAKREETLFPPSLDSAFKFSENNVAGTNDNTAHKYSSFKGIRLPINSPAMRILIKLRNEAHRFANLFQKKLQSKRVSRSALLHLPGIGVKTVQKLMRTFGSLEKVATSSPEEIAQLSGISKKSAETIFSALSSGIVKSKSS